MPDLPVSDDARSLVTPLTLSILHQAGGSAYGALTVRGAPAQPPPLHGIAPEQLFVGPVRHPDDAAAALAGLWLWFDDLHESHRIAQEIVSGTGSCWHAIVHRREGDFSNAKYWYRRCAGHHVLRMMGAVAASAAGEAASDPAVAHALSDGWNPDGFVDLVEAVRNRPEDPRHAAAVRLQRVEWIGLFDYCLHEAVEADHTDPEDWAARVQSMTTG